jgi:probable HAF family extracellular repeat protein
MNFIMNFIMNSQNISCRAVRSAVVLAVVSAVSGTAFAQTRSMHDLGTLGGASSFATAINENDIVVGRSAVANGDTHAFVYRSWTGMEDLGTLGGNYSDAAAISNSGIAVGTAEASAGDYCGKPVTWDTNNGNSISTLPELPPNPLLPCSHPMAINDSGVIAGNSAGKAVRWIGGQIETLYSIERTNCWGADINSAGEVLIQCVGWTPRGFVWHNGQVTEIENWGTSTFSVNAINDQGVVVGYGQRPDGSFAAFSWDNGVLSDLATFGGYANASDISESGVIAGEATINGSMHAVWWNWNGQIEDLGTLSDSNFSAAFGTTSGGIITGVSYVDTGNSRTNGFHAVVWQ